MTETTAENRHSEASKAGSADIRNLLETPDEVRGEDDQQLAADA